MRVPVSVFGVLCLSLAGCKPDGHKAAQNAAALVHDGDPRACNASEVQQIVAAAVLGTDASQVTGLSGELRDVTAAHVEAGLAVQCSATFGFRHRGQPIRNSVGVTYEVRLLIDKPGEVSVVGDFGRAAYEASLIRGAFGG